MRTAEQQIIDTVQKAQNILISFKENYTGDALASALALYLFFKKIGKQTHIAAAHFSQPPLFSFLPHIQDIRPELKTAQKFVISLATDMINVKEISYHRLPDKLEFFITPDNGSTFKHEHISSHTTGHDYDLIVTVGTPDLESLGALYTENSDFFFSVPMINIDHHPDNEEYGQINCINITALATAQVLFDLLKNFAPAQLDEHIATCLLTGLISESKSFRVGSLTPHSLVAASELVELGAERERIVRHLYQHRDLRTLKLWGRVLAKLDNQSEGKIIWSSLNKFDFDKTGGTPAQVDDVIEELIVNVPEAQIILLFIEQPANQHIRVSVRTTKNINALDAVKNFGGSGDKNYASFTSDKTLAELETEVIAHFKQKLEKLPI
ncbi:hypothetical protein A2242_03835 [Candidatus Falkowbacteria bacterium RIFOXYA2_FULL_47_9]|uniref:DDH domain-containing protein n=1 Tax=Candidatus Falkowbacteria bacterium RIFOXYA2_FULL_47_9 TaxID=1797995 RepID=A0A1F5SIY8_9BACT|nr:MAG: hypothetical protein A2242_03835 [Candidatus Falkowbacteria bacterium RIFOXYA2_FULL_47_9]